MEKTLICPGCKTVFKISPQMVGKRFRCKSCSSIISIAQDFFKEDLSKNRLVFGDISDKANKVKFENPETHQAFLNSNAEPVKGGIIRKLLIAAGILAVVGIAYIVYSNYQHAQFVAALVPHIKNSSLRVANSARFEAEGGSNITYKELFEKLQTDTAEIDKRLLEVQTLSSPATQTITDPTVAYLKASQEYLRALLSKYRKKLTLDSARDQFNDSVNGPLASSSFGSDLDKRLSDQAQKKLQKAKEEYTDSRRDVLATATKLKESRDRVNALFPVDALVPAGPLDVVIQKNSP
jgi:hypothetical protein